MNLKPNQTFISLIIKPPEKSLSIILLRKKQKIMLMNYEIARITYVITIKKK